MYVEEILDHFRNPSNYGEIQDADINVKDVNTLCGDGFEFFVKLSDGHVKDVRFKGEGCAISTASASMLSDFVKGKSLEEITAIHDDQMIQLLGIPISPARRKCALLPLEILKSGVNKSKVVKC